MQSDILVAGECLVDFIPDRPGPLETVEQFRRRAGGAPANVAVRLAGLGPAPLLWTRLGDDPFGRYLAGTLEKHGIPGKFVITDEVAKTALAFVAHDEDADRGFTFYREGTADTRFEPKTVPDEILEEMSWVAFGGVCLTDEPARRAMLDLATRARQYDCQTFFDPNARPELWPDGFDEALEKGCARASVVKATPEDLSEAGIEGSPDELLDAVLDMGPHTAILTLGSDGAVGKATRKAPWGPATAEHDGFDVEVVDTTGAGDAFAAGLLRGLADGRSLDETLAFGNAAAAVTTTSEGAMSASVGRESVEALLE
ncbi:carbohydrate kinase family protein [Halobacteriaceae archaeon SHR40]|uniref:carbohydrate kinase family protein n=1 Tax=Halovenus amylolytica TaxID=2500550 RepID=UPI000FE421D0